MLPGDFVSVATITSGGLTFQPAANANGIPYTTLTFQVQDDGGTNNGGVNLDPSPKTLTINVSPVNDPPTGANMTVTTPEDTDYTFAQADFGFSDLNDQSPPSSVPSNTLANVIITSLPVNGTLLNNNQPIAVNAVISLNDLLGNNFKFRPAANANGGELRQLWLQGARHGWRRD